MKYLIQQHFQGKQSKSETHKYFKRGSFQQKLSRNQVFIIEKSNKHVHQYDTDGPRFRQTDLFPLLFKNIGFKESQIRPLQDNLNVNVDLSSRLLFPSRNQMQIACLHLWNILESFNFTEVYFASERPIRKKLLPCLKLVRLAWSGR